MATGMAGSPGTALVTLPVLVTGAVCDQVTCVMIRIIKEVSNPVFIQIIRCIMLIINQFDHFDHLAAISPQPQYAGIISFGQVIGLHF